MKGIPVHALALREIAQLWDIMLVYIFPDCTHRVQHLALRDFTLQESARELEYKADYQANGEKTPRPVIAANLGAVWELISDEVTEIS
jgi:hypothetical protein